VKQIKGKILKGRQIRNFIWLLSLLLLFFAFVQSGSAAVRKKNTSEPLIRVKLGKLHKKVEVAFVNNGHVKNSRGRRIRTIRGKSKFSWQLPSSKRRSVQYNNQTMTFEGNGNLFVFNGKKYRGKLVVKFTKSGALVVNHVGIEDYLRGVVGSEMGSLSPAESLKAQTIIARTYAYSNRGKHGRDGADVCDSTHCQVYKGVSSERDTINKAVDGTRGIIMISEGKPIETLYHATCGGMTSDNDKVFGGAPRSYLRRVLCPFCRNGSKYRWAKTLNLHELKAGLAKEKIHFNRLYDLGYESPGLMDRVAKVIFLTDKGEISIKGTTFRRLFNLNSTTFTLGNRNSVKNLISSAVEVPAKSRKEPQTNVAGKQHRTILAGIGNAASDGPPQLIIQTAKGLKRVTRPEEGWKTIACGLILAQPEKKEIATKPAPRATKPGAKSDSNGLVEKIEIFGRGFGHQVGLCQSGAIELGKRNWSYRQILPFYYSNVALRQLDY
jgi:stage II sporulation protein D